MNYTKGEWSVDPEIEQDGYFIRCLDENEDGESVAFVYPFGKNPKANAHLIVAAPDMYEALKGWDKLRAMRPLDSGADIDAILQKCAEITDKALARAEGK